MDVPTTVRAALSDQPVENARCLEAGAGVGNTTAGLLQEGADRVYAVTNNPVHAELVHDRIGRAYPNRTAVVEADLRAIPLSDDSVEIITAHGLFNVLPPTSLGDVVSEFTRVAAPGCRLIVDDYEPPPEGAAIWNLFSLENAASQLADDTPALTFYPERVLRQQFVGSGWSVGRRKTLLEPVPWTKQHVRAHANRTSRLLEEVADELASPLEDELERIVASIGSESTGRMYSVSFRSSQ
ncbi:class I SAM-dependent methyltransferase [Haloferax namakaokahaiae]|uniref:Class I SAM-dependent methyltransferase n=1 Tax=Haloferax namakaokahaiae TaxID=1748331 RepID=A0ABD5ZDA9_9EURY